MSSAAVQISAEQVRTHLEKILASKGFVEAGRLGPFLRFLVDETLAGRAQQLKETVIGVEVFQRAPGYDPRLDPIVRVEARRLRARLKEYYENAGREDAVRIELAKPGYVPVFAQLEPAAASPHPPERPGWTAIAMIAAFVLAGVLLYVAGARLIHRAPAGGTFTSIVVLPFLNLSADPENEYFSDGLTEQLIDALTNVNGLRVVARTSSFQFKGKAVDVEEIGRRLGVGALVEGSVRKSGDRLRVTAQLINTVSRYHLWSHTYDREMRDVFAVQDEISRAIVNALRVQLGAGHPLVRQATENLDAYNLYLKGRYQFNRYSREGVMKAIDCFNQAAQADPNYAPAYAMLASAYSLIGYYREAPAGVVWPKAKAAAEKAIALDDSLAEAHSSLGYAKGIHDWDWGGAEQEFRRAIELNPNSADAHCGYALICLIPTGRLDGALVEAKKALELDPVFVINNLAAAQVYFVRHNYDQAIEQYRKTLDLNQNLPDTWGDLGMVLAFQGRRAEAIAAFEKQSSIGSGKAELGATEYALLGERDKAEADYARLDEAAKQQYLRPIDVARLSSLLGHNDAAFAWLEKAFTERDPQLIWLKVDPRFDPIRGDARFAGYLKRLGLAN